MNNEIIQKRVFSAFETAKILSIGHNRVRELVRAGVLNSLPGRNLRITDHSINQYIITLGDKK